MDDALSVVVDVASVRSRIDEAIDAVATGRTAAPVPFALFGEAASYATQETMGGEGMPFSAWTGEAIEGDASHQATIVVFAGSLVASIRTTHPDGTMTVERLQPIADHNGTSEEAATRGQRSVAIRGAALGDDLDDDHHDHVDDAGRSDSSTPGVDTPPLDTATAGVGRAADVSDLGAVRAVTSNDRTIDVLIAYSSTARSEAGSTATIAANALAGIVETNSALSNSGLEHATRLRVVGLDEYPYTTGGTDHNQTQWIIDRLKFGGNTQLQKIRDDRLNVAADAVVFIDQSDLSGCGRANGAFSSMTAWHSNIVMRYDALVGTGGCGADYTFTHEFGHYFGIAHDDEPSGIWASYSRAYKDNSGGNTFTTVSAVFDSCCARQLIYSNPDRTWAGEASGTVTRDGARTIDQTSDDRAAHFLRKKDWVDVEPKFGSTSGYLRVNNDGRVVAAGSATFVGDRGANSTIGTIVGIASDPDGTGYWMVDDEGCVYAYSAPNYGDVCALNLNEPVVGIEEYRSSSGNTKGYYMVAADGGVFSFNAPFYGSAGAINLDEPIVDMARDPDGAGYWLLASDGGVFSYSATFHGSAQPYYQSWKPAMAIDTYTSGGYWIVARDGGIFSFGSVPFDGSYTQGTDFMVNIAARGSTGYWMLENDGDVIECVNGCVHP